MPRTQVLEVGSCDNGRETGHAQGMRTCCFFFILFFCLIFKIVQLDRRGQQSDSIQKSRAYWVCTTDLPCETASIHGAEVALAGKLACIIWDTMRVDTSTNLRGNAAALRIYDLRRERIRGQIR